MKWMGIAGCVIFGFAIPASLLASAGSTALSAQAHAIAVGTASLTIADSSRRDSVDTRRPREWRVDLYYPARAQRGRSSSPYASDPALIRAMVAEDYYQVAPQQIQQWLKRPGPALHRAAPAMASALPLITISPGLGVAAFNYSILAAALVRKGFVVAVIDHPYIGIIHLPDGRILRVEQDPALQDQDQSHWRPRIADWRQDISVSLDRIASRRSRGYPNGLRIDSAGVTSVGHSLGGAVALDACKHDERISACADFEGVTFGTETFDNGPSKPTLFVLSRSGSPDRPRDKPDFGNPMFAFLAKGSRPSVWAVKITGGSHMSFSDAPAVMPKTLSQFGGTLMTADRSMEVYSGLVAAFARAYRNHGGGDSAFEGFVNRIPEAKAKQVRSPE